MEIKHYIICINLNFQKATKLVAKWKIAQIRSLISREKKSELMGLECPLVWSECDR